MCSHDRHTHHPRRYEQRARAREKDHDHGEQDQPYQGFAIGERAAQDHEGLIGRSVSVEEEPRGEEGEEEEEGEGVVEEGDCEYERE